MYTSMSMIYKKENCIYVLQQGLDLLKSESGARKKEKNYGEDWQIVQNMVWMTLCTYYK